MKRRVLHLYFSVILLTVLLPLTAQNRLPVIAVYTLDAVNADEATAKNIENLIFSFLSEQKNFTVLDLRTNDGAPDTADYICKSTLKADSNEFTLILTMEKNAGASDGYTAKTVSRSYESYNRILLESRTMIKELLDAKAPPKNTAPSSADTADGDSAVPEAPAVFKPLLNLSCLSGTWKGNCGIERVVIMRTGKAMAVLENGASMMLDLFIHNGALVARQKGPSNPRYFNNIPVVIAAQAAKDAAPFQWEMQLSEDENTLTGIKHDINVIHDGQTIVSIEKTTPQTIWTREN